jgi:alkyldihydroxyacetonephosphate synthase
MALDQPSDDDRARREMKWWGWGDPDHIPHLPDHAVAFLRAEVGIADRLHAPMALEDVRLGEPALPEDARKRLAAAVGEEHVRDDRHTRVVHAAGKSYPDLVRQRAGLCEGAPDAVVSPASTEEVSAVLEVAGEAGVAVVPFGGGTSVVGGVDAERGPFGAAISLDLGRMDALLALDERSLTATFGPGIRGPEAEALLARRGLTLGHFPQSYEFASLGGFAATRSAGQASTGYGRFDELVLGLRCAAPAGELRASDTFPATAAGPSLREVLVGSEGALGVITELTVRVRPRPPERRFDGWFFRSFAEGAEAFRELEQRRAAPDVARMSDEDETRTALAFAGGSGARDLLGRAYLRARGYTGGCLVVAGWDGSAVEMARRRAAGARILRHAGGLPLGRGPGTAWERSRFETPYLRDDMLERGVMVETLETATNWSNLLTLHGAVRGALHEALGARGTPPLVLCHVSHLYPSGASLYFTFMARQEASHELDQWQAAKRAASDAIVANGGTITHHHAIGRDHVPWMRAEAGPLGVDVLRATKAVADPAGIMNPGKLLPEV